MPQGYEVTNANGERAWWDGKKLTPLNAEGMQVAAPGQATEGARTAAFLGSRVADSVKNLASITQRDPAAAKPGFWERAAEQPGAPIIGNPLNLFGGGPNLFRSADRQQVVTNQLDLLDAALTLGTGAAYTKEQLANYRDTYFPSMTDKPENVAAKQRKLLALLQAAKLKAGSASPPILDQAIANANAQWGEGSSQQNPFTLTTANRGSIPQGSYFKAADGRVYRNQKGAGYKPQGGSSRPGPAGVDATTWAHMTPQEQALWP